MRRVDRFLFGMGLPDAGIEESTFVKTGNVEKEYGRRVTLYAGGVPLIYIDEVEVFPEKNIKKALIFLANYSGISDFDMGVDVLRGIIKEFGFDRIKVSSNMISIGSSKIIEWVRMNPVSLSLALEFASRENCIVMKNCDDKIDVFKYSGNIDNTTGGKVYVNKKGKEVVYYRGLVFPAQYFVTRIGNYTVLDTEEGIVLLGKNTRAYGDNIGFPNVKTVIRDVERNAKRNWVLRNFSKYSITYERNAGAFRIVKTEYLIENSTQYEVLSSSGQRVFETYYKVLGENLNLERIRKVLF